VARVAGPGRALLDRAAADYAALVGRELAGSAAVAAQELRGDPDEARRVLAAWHARIDDLLLPTLQLAWHAGAAHARSQFREEAGLLAAARWADVPTPQPALVEAALAGASNRLAGAGEELWERAREQLLQGVQLRESTEQLRRRLQGAVGLAAPRAGVIARTEVMSALNAGSLQQMLAIGLPARKTWLAADDERTRPDHNTADNQTVDLRDPFTVGGWPLQRPHDPAGPPEQTINCRCGLAYDVELGGVEPGGVPVSAAGRDRRVLDAAASGRLARGIGAVALAALLALEEDQEAETAAAGPRWALQAAAGDQHSGAMVALLPREDNPRAPLALDPDVVPDAETPEQLHLTLAYLGDADDWSDEQRQALIGLLQPLAERLPAGQAHVFGAAHWNVNTDDPSWVLNVGGEGLEDVHGDVWEVLRNAQGEVPLPELPEQHAPWVPHICLAYSADPGLAGLVEARVGRDLELDRLRVAFGAEVTDLKLAGPVEELAAAAFHNQPGDHPIAVRDLTGDLTGMGKLPGSLAGRIQGVNEQFHDRYGFSIGNAEPLSPNSRAFAQVTGSTLLFNPKQLRDGPLIRAERDGWLAPGTGKVEGAMTHELGHLLLHGNYGPGAGGKGQTAMIKAKVAARNAGMTTGVVSRYGQGSRIEADAELFAHYHWGGAKREPWVVAWGETYHRELGLDATPFSEAG
jgi:2'-5' RNA ligase